MSDDHDAGQGEPASAPSGRPWRRGAVWRALLAAAGVMVVCLGGSEMVERLWWPQLDDATQHLVHLARGALCSVLVAVAVGWQILRSSPGLLAAPSLDAEWAQGVPATRDRLHHYARWFIAMRWIAVVLAGLLIFISVQLLGWLPQEVWWPLSGTVAALAGLNVLYTYCLRWPRAQSLFLRAQVYLDLVVLTSLLHFSGGIENQLSMMAIFHVVIGGILLSRHQCYWIAGVAGLLFALMAFGEWGDVIGHYKLELFPHVRGMVAHHTLYVSTRVLLQAGVLFLTAYFVTTLAERLRDREGRLEDMAERAVAGQRLLEQAMETAGAGLRVLDPELKVFWANARWHEWFAAPTGPAQGAAGREGEGSPAAKTLADGQVRVTEMTRAAPHGGTHSDSSPPVFQITTAPLRNVNGTINRVVELAQDITEQKRTQAQILRAGQLAAVGELAGRVAHEVNNPVGIISAKARLLLANCGSEMSPKVAQELAKITDCADRVARIAQGLLSYCRPSPGHRVPLDLRLPIRRSLAMVEEYVRKTGVVVSEELAEVLPPVRASANELEQVFLNLFLNALDAMPRGGRLTIFSPPAPGRLRDGRPCVAVAVQDSGEGIPEALRERIFEPFFTTKNEGRGTGLGLPICQGLVHSQGGDLELATGAGPGACFVVRLPVAVAQEKETASHG